MSDTRAARRRRTALAALECGLVAAAVGTVGALVLRRNPASLGF